MINPALRASCHQPGITEDWSLGAATNVGTDLIMGMCKDPELLPEAEGIAKALRAPLLKTFPAALLGRIVVIPYYPLSDAMLGRIIRLQMDRTGDGCHDRLRRGSRHHGVTLRYDDAVVQLIASRCTEPESGGRMIDAILTNTVLPQISREFLERMSQASSTTEIAIGVADGEFNYRFA